MHVIPFSEMTGIMMASSTGTASESKRGTTAALLTTLALAAMVGLTGATYPLPMGTSLNSAIIVPNVVSNIGQMVDVNGDQLADFLVSVELVAGQPPFNVAYLNNGAGFSGVDEWTGLADAAFVPVNVSFSGTHRTLRLLPSTPHDKVHATVASAFSLPAGAAFHFVAEDGSVFPVSALLPRLPQGTSYTLVLQNNRDPEGVLDVAGLVAPKSGVANLVAWSREEVAAWVVHGLGLAPTVAQVLYAEEITGAVLLDMTLRDLRDIGLKFGPAATVAKAVQQAGVKEPSNPQAGAVRGVKAL